MGRMLGVFDNDEELDRPDLNKCPDCGCFFAQDECPLCGKTCPEEMRAGNRKAVKKKKRPSSGSGRVTFIEWYHSWWFIVIMMFIFPLVGIALLVTSPHQKSKKIIFCCIAAAYMVLSTIGIGAIISMVGNVFDRPVDTSLTKDEYISACEEVSAEEFYRSPDAYKGEFVKMTLTVEGSATYYNDGFYYTEDDGYYICRTADGGSIRLILRDCLIEGKTRLIPGDVITVYGQGGGEKSVYDSNYNTFNGACLNMAYVELVK